MIRFNLFEIKAIRDHVNHLKDMLLFHQEQNGLYRFDDQLTLMDYKLKQVLDRDGHSREIIQFVSWISYDYEAWSVRVGTSFEE